jgi:hypothetical protein
MSSNNNRTNQSLWSNLCTPAKLYGIFSLVSISGFLYSSQLISAISQALFSVIWLFVLNLICGEGWTGLSWFLVILPIIGGIILFMAGASVAFAEIAQAEARMAQNDRKSIVY